MKCRLFLLILASLSFSACSQNSLSDYEAHFSALIVSDFEKSLTWYTQNLRCTVLDRTDPSQENFKQANLQCGKSLLELIELESAVSPELMPNYTSRTRLIGIFKTGYLISNFDEWLAQLSESGVEFRGDVVENERSGKRMLIILDPDGNRVQLFEA